MIAVGLSFAYLAEEFRRPCLRDTQLDAFASAHERKVLG